MEQFWGLQKGEFRIEVYKLIKECSFDFKPEHIEFFSNKIKLIPPERMALEELQCLCELV
jgi:hypothetical protein